MNRPAQPDARSSVRLVSLELGFTVFVQFVSGIALARILDPSDFGLYAITVTVHNLIGLFSDWGAKQRIIQSRDAPDERMLKVALTSRLILSGLVLAGVWVLAGTIAGFYTHRPLQLGWMIRVYSVILVLTAVRQNCEIGLERDLIYLPLVLVGMLEVFCGRALMLILALSGFGAWSFIWGQVLTFVLATVLIWKLSGAPLGLAWDSHVNRELIRSGLAFRFNLMGMRLRKFVLITLVTKILGLDAAGYVKWAQDTGGRSLLLVQSASRVALSHFSRLQDRPDRIEAALSRYVFISVFLLGLWFSVLTVAGRDLILLIYTEKWLPAWEATCVFAFGAMIVAIVRFAVAALQGVGRALLAMIITCVQAVITCAIAAVVIPFLGITGAPWAESVALGLSVPFLVMAIPGIRPRLLLRPLVRQVLPLLLALAAGWWMAQLNLPLMHRAFLNTALTTFIYVGASLLTAPPWMRRFVREEVALFAGLAGRATRRGG